MLFQKNLFTRNFNCKCWFSQAVQINEVLKRFFSPLHQAITLMRIKSNMCFHIRKGIQKTIKRLKLTISSVLAFESDILGLIHHWVIKTQMSKLKDKNFKFLIKTQMPKLKDIHFKLFIQICQDKKLLESLGLKLLQDNIHFLDEMLAQNQKVFTTF